MFSTSFLSLFYEMEPSSSLSKSCLAPLNLHNSRQDFSSKDILIYRLLLFFLNNSFQRFQYAYEVTAHCEAEGQEEGIL